LIDELYDLRKLTRALTEAFPRIEALYLFGSRRYRTGSRQWPKKRIDGMTGRSTRRRLLRSVESSGAWRATMRKKPKTVWVGNTPVTPLTSKERRNLHKLMKRRLDMRRRKYPEVRGKVVDFISHSIDDGVLRMNVCFKDETLFSLRYACDMFLVGADISDWTTGNYEIIREYMKPTPR
jgi:hypothetical protein